MIKTKLQAINRLKDLNDIYIKSNKDKQGLIMLEVDIILHRIAINYYEEKDYELPKDYC